MPCEAKGRVDETNGAWEMQNGTALEIVAARAVEMEVYSEAGALMAGKKEGHSVSMIAVEGQGDLEEVL